MIAARAKMSALVALAAGAWGGFHPLIQTLVVLIFLDFASGLLYAWGTGTVSSDASFRGMAKKSMMLLLVGAAHVYNATQPLGFDAAAAVAGFFCATEFISITENAGRLGVPLPKILTAAIHKLRDQMEGGPDGQPKP
jgi:toxin secretion/phage lysis holin